MLCKIPAYPDKLFLPAGYYNDTRHLPPFMAYQPPPRTIEERIAQYLRTILATSIEGTNSPVIISTYSYLF